MMADSAMELYAAKLMVLHAAYKIEHDLPFARKSASRSITWRTPSGARRPGDPGPRALGYSTDTPGADAAPRPLRAPRRRGDEVHQALIARNVRRAYAETG